MSTAPNGPPREAAAPQAAAPQAAAPQAGAPQKTDQPEVTQAQTSSKSDAKPKDEKAESSASAKLSGAEIKARAKAEKAARRAQVKASKDGAKGEAAVSSSPTPLGPSASEAKGNKAKGKQDGAAASGATAAGRIATSKGPVPAVITEPKVTIPECFSHLPMAKRIPITQADKDVHPTVLALGQQMATFAIDESIIRLKATLLAFKKVIESYNTPPGNTLARHLTPHVLNPQIDYLTACRPMCFSMGNAIRWLKLQVSKIDPDVPDQEAKKELCVSIDNFIQERISVADLVIAEKATDMIKDGDTILVFGRSNIVERALLHAHCDAGKKFAVTIVDDPYERKGQVLAKKLAAEGIKVTYSGDFGGLRWHAQRATKVLLGAESMFHNGAMYGKSGSCDLAIAAKELGLYIIVLCETINITERVATDSLTYNEIDPERSSAASFRLLYDTTPSAYLSVVVTELGSVQPTSVPDLLRKLEESN
ncbi:Uu.00g089490.m01.CDS01 [Anthostomella pinea]|uniref:Translation initiation factor eIF2B subunit delta n=1 Tax=Anthostomella pinea TaxID=933095 RepID=A0AAI8VHA6_9PEZI|nr:Uu.00g089490.m01.CDS01 [Anthostomella pinea]